MKHAPAALSGALFISLLMGSIWVFAQDLPTQDEVVPRLIPYQGHLDFDGEAVHGPTTFTFSLYNSPTSNTPPLWSEEITNVDVFSGSFAVVLGKNPNNPISPEAAQARELYLGMSVGGVVLSNRQQILGSPATVPAAHTVPPGTIVAYGGDVPPHGWLLCNGTSASRQIFPALWSAIGENFGAGEDGVDGDAFGLPNLQDMFLRGAHPGRAPGHAQEDTTRAPRTPFVATEAGAHTHTVGLNRSDTGGMVIGGSAQRLAHFNNDHFGANAPHNTGASGNHTHPVAGGDTETRPRNIAVNYIIKY